MDEIVRLHNKNRNKCASGGISHLTGAKRMATTVNSNNKHSFVVLYLMLFVYVYICIGLELRASIFSWIECQTMPNEARSMPEYRYLSNGWTKSVHVQHNRQPQY